jgi:hypothetical protein
VVRTFVDRQGGDQFAGGDLGQIGALCASLPPRMMADAAARAEESSGEAVSVRPVSSRIRPRLR